MKVFLIYPDRDMQPNRKPVAQTEDLMQDLNVGSLIDVMADGDEYVGSIAHNVLFAHSVNRVEEVLFRQAVLRDCMEWPSLPQTLDELALASIQVQKKTYFWSLSRYPSAMVRSSTDMLEGLLELLRQLRSLVDDYVGKCSSQGFRRFFAMIQAELDEAYFTTVEGHLKQLHFKRGELVSARLGDGNKGIEYTLRKPHEPEGGWLKRLVASKPKAFRYRLHERDEAGARILSELRDQGLNEAANVLVQSARHVLDFFDQLRTEITFYRACLNLKSALDRCQNRVCFPEPDAPERRRHACSGLYDPCLALRLGKEVVSNDFDAGERVRVVVTGANQGGKSTFLRAVGLAQIMMQAGMFVSADRFSANLSDGLFTHYKREEDRSMTSGKLDEELHRMSRLIDALRPDSLLLSNESFAVTNQREGAEILQHLSRALAERGIKAFFVTHLYDFAHDLYVLEPDDTLFLRAQREDDGSRSFRVTEGAPLRTAFGTDLYRQIFIDDANLVAGETNP